MILGSIGAPSVLAGALYRGLCGDVCLGSVVAHMKVASSYNGITKNAYIVIRGIIHIIRIIFEYV